MRSSATLICADRNLESKCAGRERFGVSDKMRTGSDSRTCERYFVIASQDMAYV
jgi:hypothetical protein